MNDSDAKNSGEQSGRLDWWVNGLIVSTSFDPSIQQSTNPFIR